MRGIMRGIRGGSLRIGRSIFNARRLSKWRIQVIRLFNICFFQYVNKSNYTWICAAKCWRWRWNITIGSRRTLSRFWRWWRVVKTICKCGIAQAGESFVGTASATYCWCGRTIGYGSRRVPTNSSYIRAHLSHWAYRRITCNISCQSPCFIWSWIFSVSNLHKRTSRKMSDQENMVWMFLLLGTSLPIAFRTVRMCLQHIERRIVCSHQSPAQRMPENLLNIFQVPKYLPKLQKTSWFQLIDAYSSESRL